MSIYVGVKGYLDKVVVQEVGKFEREFLLKIKTSYQELLESIRIEQKISDKSEAILKKAIEEFLIIFLNHNPSGDIIHPGLS